VKSATITSDVVRHGMAFRRVSTTEETLTCLGKHNSR